MPRAPQRCSRTCKEKAVRGGRCEKHQPPRIAWQKSEDSPNRDYLNSAEWARQRRRVLFRDNTFNGGCRGHYVPKCTGVAETVDHILPVWYSQADQVEDEDLQGLCKPCHDYKSSRDGYFAKMAKRAKES